MHRFLSTAGLIGVVAIVGTLACSRAIRPTRTQPLTAAQMAEFWVDRPIASRDLWRGPVSRSVPRINGTYRWLESDTAGFSPGYKVKDAAGVQWDVKLGPEAKPEVVASRLVWAMGYHQLPAYYVPRWKLAGSETSGPQSAGRFRPMLRTHRLVDHWSWHENPFVGTRPYRGLLVLMAMLNNSDLKPAQNAIFTVAAPRTRRQRLFIVVDLGHTFGASGIHNARRGDITAFEKHGFIERIDDGHVDFEQRGLRAELLEQITTDDLRWICRRLAQLSDKQWADAFRAAAYHPTESKRFIARMKAKIAQGLRGQPDRLTVAAAS